MYQKALKRYLDDLAARKPAPGGGSASALTGAIGTSLISMVANFTIGRERYQSVQKEVERVLSASEGLSKQLSALIDEDVSCYQELSQAYQLPKDNAQDKNKRSEAIQKGLKEALTVPLEICKCCYRAMKLCPVLAGKGNVNLISDVGVAAVFLESAFQGALLNVEINLNGIKDAEFVVEVRKVLEPLEKDITAIKDQVWQKVKQKMKEG